MQVAANLFVANEPGGRPGQSRLDFAHSFTELRLHERKSGAAVNVRLVRHRHLCAGCVAKPMADYLEPLARELPLHLCNVLNAAGSLPKGHTELVLGSAVKLQDGAIHVGDAHAGDANTIHAGYT